MQLSICPILSLLVKAMCINLMDNNSNSPSRDMPFFVPVFENRFLFSKTRKTGRTRLVFSFFKNCSRKQFLNTRTKFFDS